MKRTFFIILNAMVCNYAIAQNFHKGSVLIQYDDRSKPMHSNSNKLMNVYFDSGFNDSLEVYINNKLVKKDFFKTNHILSTTGKSITVKMSDKLPPKILTVKDITTKESLEIMLDWRYKTFEIHKSIYRDDTCWLTIYTNEIIEME